MSIDLTKPVQTRDGRPVRILCADLKGTCWPIVGAVQFGESESIVRWNCDGQYEYKTGGRDDPCDLIPIPKKHSRWVKVYDCGLMGGVLQTDEDRERIDAERRDGDPRYRWIPVEIDESKAT